MKTFKFKIILAILLLTSFGTILSGGLILSNYLTFIDDSIDSRLEHAVQAADAMLAPGIVDALTVEGAEDSIFFNDTMQLLSDLNAAMSTEYIYGIIKDAQGKFVFIMDSGEIDDPEEGSSYLEEVTDWPSLDMAWESGELVIDSEYFTDEWGTFKSACLPVLDSSGNVVLAYGADISAENIKAVKKRTWLIFIICVFIVILLCLFLSLLIGTRVLKPVNTMSGALKEISSGDRDLTKRILHKTEDEFGDMAESYNLFIEKIGILVKKIIQSGNALNNTGAELSSNTEQTSAAITEISANIGSVKSLIEKQIRSLAEYSDNLNGIINDVNTLDGIIDSQSASIEESSASIEQMVSNINSVSGSVQKSDMIFQQLKEATENGKNLIETVNEQAVRIEGQSEILQQANSVIAGIASQTNLLAMNAAIEAAHAGEAGKGFSVVADEIRKLAEQSSIQSKSIGESLNSVLSSITGIVESTKHTDRAFEDMIVFVKEMQPINSQINQAMNEQSSGSSQILEALSSLKIITVEVKDKSESMRNGGNQISSLLDQFNRISSEVSTGISEIENGTAEINQAAEASAQLAETNRETLAVLSRQTAKFKV